MAFNDCIRDFQLNDLTTSGCAYSWTNKHMDGTRVWSRLDRAMVYTCWLQYFPNSTATVMTPGISDHSPLLISVFVEQRYRKHFSFLNCWIDSPHYTDYVKDG
ncbi:uncharacterized protein LOC141651351 [Silene latifolia]|uniref:uncharacterized protein LOC141651351 n=1 Tax=Silene latifolia TaxID=37657 RepID=UPI003D774AF6